MYAYGRIEKLACALRAAQISQDVTAQILEDGETISQRTPPARKAAWMARAMARMVALLDAPTRHAVREACACCLGGKRLEVSTRIARTHATLDDRLVAANAAPFVFGHSVTRQPDGRILVQFAPDGLPGYRCVCLPKATEPISDTYCYCCGGHIRHHLQIALGCRLTCEVHTSALSSGGTQPCAFLFTIEA
jgi:hypothetical protein